MSVAEELPPGLVNRLARARFCLVCQTVKADGLSHKSRTGHDNRPLDAEEKESEKERWFARQRGDVSAQAEEIQQRARRQRADHAASASQPEVPEAAEYRVPFGKHKGKTLAEVSAADKGYLPWCIVSRVHVSQPSLQRALEQAGLWRDVLREAEVLREQKRAESRRAGRGVQVEASQDPASPTQPALHPEVQKLRQLQEKEESAPTAKEMVAEAAPLFRDQVGQGKKRKRKSTAMVQLKIHKAFAASAQPPGLERRSSVRTYMDI